MITGTLIGFFKAKGNKLTPPPQKKKKVVKHVEKLVKKCTYRLPV